MKKQLMSFKDINPNVRYINLLQCTPDFEDGPRCIYDYQFIYIHRGKGKLTIDHISYPALPGDLFFVRPQISHTYRADSEEPYLISGIHFDFTGNQKQLPFPIGPFALAKYGQALIPEIIGFSDLNEFPSKMSFYSDNKIEGLILGMVNEFKNARIFSREFIDGQHKSLLSMVARKQMTQNPAEGGTVDNEAIISEVIEYLQKHYSENITNQTIAKTFHFHPNYLSRLMVLYTGVPLRQYLIDTRIKAAMDLLVHTRLSVSEVAQRIGYQDAHYFSRIFKKKTGMSPRTVKSNYP